VDRNRLLTYRGSLRHCLSVLEHMEYPVGRNRRQHVLERMTADNPTRCKDLRVQKFESFGECVTHRRDQ